MNKPSERLRRSPNLRSPGGRATTALIALLLACGTVAVAADDPVARLRSARSLHCIFTSTIGTTIKNGHRTIQQTNDKGTANFDNIDLAKGTARMITEDNGGGVADLTVWWERLGSLWLVERSPSGNMDITTVYPMYAEGTHDFIVLESRHMAMGSIILGEAIYGTCRILE